MAYFSKNGAKALIDIFEECNGKITSGFHEASSFKTSGITDILQELIDRGYQIKAMEIYKGWREIHPHEDITNTELNMSELIKGI